ncbi:MAG: hypothetical protein ACT4OD_07150 [Candidatus Nitrosotenuis sp.]
MTTEQDSTKSHGSVNFYVLTLFFVLIVAFEVANFFDPIVEPQLDGFELLRLLGFPAAAIFSFWTAKRYWGSTVFGKAYLALGIGYAFYTAGDVLWYVYEIILQEAPYPSLADIGYFGFYPFAIYHLRKNTHYFKRKLDKRQRIILLAIPIGSCIIYSFFSLVVVDVSSGIFHAAISSEMHQVNGVEFLVGLAYIAATTVVFSYAIIGVQVFYYGKLGAAWCLLAIGIGLNTFADYYYYYSENFGEFLRNNPIHGIWIISTMIVCYSLYKHMKTV